MKKYMGGDIKQHHEEKKTEYENESTIQQLN